MLLSRCRTYVLSFFLYINNAICNFFRVMSMLTHLIVGYLHEYPGAVASAGRKGYLRRSRHSADARCKLLTYLYFFMNEREGKGAR